jgi:hypothetical protein
MAAAFRGGTRKSKAEFDMTAAIAQLSAKVDAIDRRIGSGGNSASRAVQFYKAGQIDGKVTLTDGLDAFVIMVATFAGGTCVAASASYLFGVDLVPAAFASLGGAGAIGIGRIVVDMIAPAIRAARWVVRAWRVKDLWPLFEEWLENRDDDTGGDTTEPQEPGWIVINGERHRREQQKSEAEKTRDAVLKFVNIVWSRQSAGRNTGQKALRGYPLLHGYKVTDDFHREMGGRLVDAGLAVERGSGWELTASPEECAATIGTW